MITVTWKCEMWCTRAILFFSCFLSSQIKSSKMWLSHISQIFLLHRHIPKLDKNIKEDGQMNLLPPKKRLLRESNISNPTKWINGFFLGALFKNNARGDQKQENVLYGLNQKLTVFQLCIREGAYNCFDFTSDSKV